MKKVIVVIEVLVVVLFLAKIFALGGFVKTSQTSGHALWSTNEALAESAAQGALSPETRDVAVDALSAERSLMAQLEERRRQLENRENSIRFEEKKINSLKSEIATRIQLLQGRERTITSSQESTKAEDSARFKELAKEYEAAPAEKVGALLNKMDSKTAARIIMQMNIKKAGAVWGQLSPEKAADITKVIAGM
ncbi:MAG TPA: hypothetical protein VLZ07_06435 [Syntrophales bacterium]|nr:hypothetical protein [Syntrophales bacterium]